jgi:hypothetical protein
VLTPIQNPRPTLLAITACLRDTDRLPNDIARSTTACELATWAARSIAPVNQTRRRKEEDGGFLPGYGTATLPPPIGIPGAYYVQEAQPMRTLTTESQNAAW